MIALGFDRRRTLRNLFAVPTASVSASGDNATDITGPGYLAECVVPNASSSCTFTWPSSDPVKIRGAVRSTALLRRCSCSSNTGGGPPSRDACTHITVFWWHRFRRSNRPPLSTSHTHTSCPPTLTSRDPLGSQATSSTGAPWSRTIRAPFEPFEEGALASQTRTVPS